MQIRDYMTKLFDAFGDVRSHREMLLEQAEPSSYDRGDKARAQACFGIVRCLFHQFVQEIEADDKVENGCFHAWCWAWDQ